MASKWLPGLQTLATYKAAWLKNDVIAGIVLTTLLVPQGMAYAELAGLPVITGLYTTILCLVAYALFGPSKILVLGPDSALGPMIAATIIPLLGADGNPERAVALASTLALLVGVIMVLAGIFKLGFVADLLSKPTRIGYMNGLAITILVGQLPKLFGFSIHADGLINEVIAFVHGLGAGETVIAAVAIGLVSLILILAIGRWLPRIPGVLVAVLFAIVATSLFDLAYHGVSLVGSLPRGFPPSTLPGISDSTVLLAGALGIALVALTDTISTASSFAARSGQEINGNGEMVGIGAANVAASLFQGFPVSTSGSRTAVAEQTGAKTQLTGIVGAVIIILMLLFFPGLLKNLPQPTLAAVVMAASLSLADISGIARLWHMRRSEFMLALTAFLGVALLGVLPGIAVAVALSIFNVFRRAWWPYQTTLGSIPGVPGYHDQVQHPEAKDVSGVVLFRFDAPLFFANARTFRDLIRKLEDSKTGMRWIVIASEPITDIDSTAADTLQELTTELQAKGISLKFAELKDPVRAKFEKYGLTGVLSPDNFFPTVESAVEDFARTQSGKKNASKRKKR